MPRVAKFHTRLAVPVALAVFLGLGPAFAQGSELSLCGLKLTFDENFDSLDVSSRDATQARWTAHTPWNGDFGDAVFTDPRDGFPFTVKDGILRIEARTGKDGKWRSGLLASADSKTNGFSQTYGYFEARMKLPDGPGVWPAFWLGTSEPRDSKDPSVEIDVIEYYGHDRDAFQTALHVWKKTKPASAESAIESHAVPAGSLSDEFHTFGVDVRRDKITYYLDRKPVWERATPKALTRPLFPLVNLALGSGHSIENTPDPSYLYVDYVRVYAPDNGQTGGCE